VAEQIKIRLQGEKLQSNSRLSSSSRSCDRNVESMPKTDHDFAPARGLALSASGGPGVRMDSHVYTDYRFHITIP